MVIQNLYKKYKDRSEDLTLEGVQRMSTTIRENTGSVEIATPNGLQKVYFRIPEGAYLTYDMKNEIMYEVNRDSANEKMRTLNTRQKTTKLDESHIAKITIKSMILVKTMLEDNKPASLALARQIRGMIDIEAIFGNIVFLFIFIFIFIFFVLFILLLV